MFKLTLVYKKKIFFISWTSFSLAFANSINKDYFESFKNRLLKGKDNYLPHTLGHEGSGIVLDVGQGVKKVHPGDHVVMTWIKGIGYDVPSTAYHSSEGLVNSGAISTFMQKTVISENRLVLIPKDIPLKEAAVLGCAVSTGAGIVLNKIDTSNCNSIAVFVSSILSLILSLLRLSLGWCENVTVIVHITLIMHLWRRYH